MKAHIPKDVRRELDAIKRRYGITKDAQAFRQMAKLSINARGIEDIKNGLFMKNLRKYK